MQTIPLESLDTMKPNTRTATLHQSNVAQPHWTMDAARAVTVEQLTAGNEVETLKFLAARAIHTVNLRGLLRDNGFVHPINRGVFYGCRDEAGQLEGVALIGHSTILDARTPEAIAAFARLAQQRTDIHVIMGEQEMIEEFWEQYATAGQSLRMIVRELLLEKRWPVEVREAVRGLRQATLDDLEAVMAVQAELAEEESGVNPLSVDSLGFRLRCARRIEQGRVWVWIEQKRLIFKADVMAKTPETIYVEGVYTHPEERGKGYGLRCISQLDRRLLLHSESVCLLVKEQNQTAQQFYQRAGYKLRSYYQTIFLERNAPSE